MITGGSLTMLKSRVTAALRASRRPVTEALSSTVMAWKDRKLPTTAALWLMEAEEPTCQ